MADTLVLDMSGTPIGFVSWQRAVKLYWEDRAVIVDEDADRILHSPSFEMNMPTVIRAKNWVHRRRKSTVPFSRRSLAIRDNSECQYCGHVLSTHEYTLDHVVPRCKGGVSSWTNLVLACMRCNKRKAGQTPQEAGMALRKLPGGAEAERPEVRLQAPHHQDAPELEAVGRRRVPVRREGGLDVLERGAGAVGCCTPSTRPQTC